MNACLTLAYLFFIGSVLGWVAELFFRKYISGSNPEHKWINPGFCVGPYVPLYGMGLCVMYLLCLIWNRHSVPGIWGDVLLVVCMAAAMTAIEYITGVIALKVVKVRLWDYSGRPGNVQGLICPLFSLIWGVLGAVYYFLVHPRVLSAVSWLSENLAFSFVIGFFFGVFTIDMAYSINLVARLKRFADENGVVVKYESLKAHIRAELDRASQKTHFIFAFRSPLALREHLRNAQEVLERYASVRHKGGHH